MNYEGNSIIPRPDKPDTYYLTEAHVLIWPEISDEIDIVIPLLRRGYFAYADQYILTVHLVYKWARGAPDWMLQVFDADTNTLIHQQTEGLDSYPNRPSTLNEQIIVNTRNLRYVAVREDHVEDNLTILAGSFFKVEKFS